MQKETEKHVKSMMGGPFKLGSMPQGYFTKDPYTEDEKCLKAKPRRAPVKIGPRYGIFKPNSYTKWVSCTAAYVIFARCMTSDEHCNGLATNLSSGRSPEAQSPNSRPNISSGAGFWGKGHRVLPHQLGDLVEHYISFPSKTCSGPRP